MSIERVKCVRGRRGVGSRAPMCSGVQAWARHRRREMLRGTRSLHLWLARTVCLLVVATGSVGTATGNAFVLPPRDVQLVGELLKVRARYEDTFLDIGRRYGIGYDELILANPGVDPWLPGEGAEVVLPLRFVLPHAPRKGLVLNVPEMRLYYFPKRKKGEKPVVITHPVSIGRMDWSTPLGVTKVTAKIRNPSWRPPASIRKEKLAEGVALPEFVPPGPDNPMGSHALSLGISGYYIHGTNRPDGIGMRVTHGCVRMFPEDIKSLFGTLPVGTPVRIVNEPYKVGWMGGILFLEAHPLLEEHRPEEKAHDVDEAMQRIAAATEGLGISVDWRRVREVIEAHTGVPVPIADLRGGMASSSARSRSHGGAARGRRGSPANESPDWRSRNEEPRLPGAPIDLSERGSPLICTSTAGKRGRVSPCYLGSRPELPRRSALPHPTGTVRTLRSSEPPRRSRRHRQPSARPARDLRL
jgi:L,D-transpeptidase ErfK/SrfK